MQVPSVLAKTALAPAVRLYDSEAFHRFPLFELFGAPVAYSESEIEYDLEQVMRRLGTWHARPTAADRASDVQYGKRRVGAMYWAESFRLESDQLSLYRLPGESADMPIQDLISKRDRYLDKNLRFKINKARRDEHKLLCDVLSTGSVSVTVDGTTQTINYGVNTETAAVTWATASTNILEELHDWFDNHTEAAGAPPTDVVIGHRFWSTYILPNDDLRDFFIRNFLTPRSAQLFSTDAGMVRPGFSPRLHIVYDRYLDSSDVAQQMWPTDKLTMLSLEPDTLERATVRTLDNDFNGGLFSYSKLHDEPPKAIEVYVTNNCVPIIRNHTAVTICDLVP